MSNDSSAVPRKGAHPLASRADAAPLPAAVSVIVPTYLEAENLPILVPRVAAALAGARIAGEILVVDDDSPDDTIAVCASLEREYPLRLIVRKGERGLSSAVIRGMREAKGEVLLVMDGDLSHPPERIPDLVAALAEPGVDFVVGSRYVHGASAGEGRGIFRWLNSRVATLLARPLTAARDPMAGFFALRRATFDAARSLDPRGFKIALELMVRCDCRGVREVPIRFGARVHGRSKLSLREQVDYLLHLSRLYAYKIGRAGPASRLALIGATGLGLDLLAFPMLLPVAPERPARALAIALATAWSVGLARRLAPGPRLALSCLPWALGAVVNWTAFVGLRATGGPFERWRMAAALCGALAGTALGWLLASRLASRGRDASSP